MIEFLNQVRKKIKKFIQVKALAKKGILLDFSVEFRKAIFEGANWIEKGSTIRYSKIGYGTYIGHNCFLNNLKIGKYCSVAKDVMLIAGNHPTKKYVSTHAFCYHGYKAMPKPKFENLVEYKERLKYIEENYFSVVGNDVWIGTGAKILNGVKIGNGAIIGAGAVVVKDVPPYAIIGGVPAKIIRYRFTEEEIKFLEEFKWWDKDLSWIEKNIELFSDIKLFISRAEQSRAEQSRAEQSRAEQSRAVKYNIFNSINKQKFINLKIFFYYLNTA